MTARGITVPEAATHRTRWRGVGRALRTARAIHPFPTTLNVAATAGLAFVAARGAPEAAVLARMLALMFCAQSAIGVTNDYFDRDLDAATKPWKPVAAGLISPTMTIAIACLFILATVALASTLGAGGFGLAILGLGAGLAYDARLKRTIWSAVPYMVGITTLPLWVWLTLGAWRDALWWLLPLGALIGFALHLVNTLPDIDGDAAHGVNGIAHRLGARRSMIAGWGAFAAALLLSLSLAPFLHYRLAVYVPAAAFALGLLAVSVGLYATRRDAFALQFGFGALGVGAAVLAGGWLGAVS